MSSRQLVTISGAVAQVNSKGVKVRGEWLNVSQYHPITPMPCAGGLVEVQVEQMTVASGSIHRRSLAAWYPPQCLTAIARSAARSHEGRRPARRRLQPVPRGGQG
jgi:hypothetical protein